MPVMPTDPPADPWLHISMRGRSYMIRKSGLDAYDHDLTAYGTALLRFHPDGKAEHVDFHTVIIKTTGE